MIHAAHAAQPAWTSYPYQAAAVAACWRPCRLPEHTSTAQRLEVVASAIAVLGLADVQHAVIGNEEVIGQ